MIADRSFENLFNFGVSEATSATGFSGVLLRSAVRRALLLCVLDNM